MSLLEETINATLDANGQLQLVHPPNLPPGPVQVTIRAASTGAAPQRGLADVLREIVAEQRANGYQGRSAEDIARQLDSEHDDDVRRDAELDAARSTKPKGSS